MEPKAIPITLLTGYLGAGKTTLLNYVLNNQKGYHVAVIVNDIGEVNIDETLIEKGASIVQEDKSVVPLSNGCICCTLKQDLLDQIVSLMNSGRFDYILIEASGICEPIPIAQTIAALDGQLHGSEGQPLVAKLDNIVSVVDASRLATEFSGGNALLKDDIDDEDIENLLVQQIEFCSTIILNKVDMLSKDELNTVRAAVRALQPKAKLIETNFCKVEINDIINTNRYDLEEALQSPGWVEELSKEEEEPETEEYGINTFVYYRRRPFDRAKLVEWIKSMPTTIIRSKGIVWYSENRKQAYVLEQAGRNVMESEYG
ncbi:MAG: GTP-binding protein, partial [Treponema sp.]|nr:GTP-binding protein [Treponema sp.]